ncbi:MAG: hypothetical protein V2I33_06335, partial [Kangiellaceae bacterium]|nr:hypothetical protein [Kangiellaceae bacterium]
MNKLWLIAAGLIILIALVLSTLRLLFPYINYYKGDIEQWLSKKLTASVTIDKIEGQWSTEGPTIFIGRLNVFDASLNKSLTYIESVEVSIDLWRSLNDLNLVTKRFNLNSSIIEIDLDDYKQDSKKNSATSSYSVNDAFLDTIFGYNNVELNNIDLI